jgi:hypothetical protein
MPPENHVILQSQRRKNTRCGLDQWSTFVYDLLLKLPAPVVRRQSSRWLLNLGTFVLMKQ